MIRYAFAVALASGFALVSHGQGAARVTVDDLMKLRTIVDVEIAPDGERVAYVVSTPSMANNAHESAIFVVPRQPAAGSRQPSPSTPLRAGDPAPLQLGSDVKVFTPALPAPRLRWSPDGALLSFLGVAEGSPQVFATSPSGGSTRALTNAPQGVIAYEWAPDGKGVAYLMRESAPASLVTQVDAPQPATRLWRQAIGGTPQALTPPTYHVDSFSWSPDGREIVYSATSAVGFTAPYYTRLYRVPANGPSTALRTGASTSLAAGPSTALRPSGEPRLLVDRAGMNTQPQYSPDGTRIAFVTTNTRMGLMAPRGLAVVGTSETGASHAVSAPENHAIRSFPLNGAWVGEMVWAADSRAIYALLNEGTFATGAHMFEMPIVRISTETGEAERVVPGPTVNYHMSLSRDGRTLAYRAIEGRTMGDLVVRDVAGGRTTTLTEVNPELKALALGELTPISWRSFDGMEIWGLLLTPPGWKAGPRLPLLVYCHGGPIGGVTYGIFPQFMHVPGQIDPYPVEAMAGAGFAVLYPMPRGGSGYGEAGHRAIINSWGEADYGDIMAGVDHVIAQGIADPERLGVMGASYGGYMTNWIVTQTTRFKAASAGASISDLTDVYYLPDGGDLMVEYFKRPWENRESYVAHSPITFVERVRTPLLIQHGERDPRVPIAGARKFYRALRALDRTVEFDIYPRGGHVLYEPVLEREAMRRNLEWFTKWIPLER